MGALDAWRAGGERTTVRLAAHDWQIFVRTEGNGPWCTLLHGFPTSSFDWHRVWDAVVAGPSFVVQLFGQLGFRVLILFPSYMNSLQQVFKRVTPRASYTLQR
jgi:hypothetical protein